MDDILRTVGRTGSVGVGENNSVDALKDFLQGAFVWRRRVLCPLRFVLFSGVIRLCHVNRCVDLHCH